MDTDSESDIQKKRPRPTGPEQACIICKCKGPLDLLTTPKDLESWRALLRAAEIQKCDALLQYKDEKDIPIIFYHLDCRKRFTHKKNLQRLHKEQEAECSIGDATEDTTKAKRDSGASTSRVLEKVCIFCGKVSKYTKGNRTREHLYQSVDLRSDATIRQLAVQRMDTKIIGLTSRELVAAEAHYHKSCYKSYTRSRPERDLPETQNEKDSDRQYSQKESEAYESLFEFVRGDLFARPRIIEMTKLCDVLESNMKCLGVELILQHTKKHLRRKLETEFGDAIEIIATDKGKLLFIPNNLSKAMLVKENFQMAAQLKSHQSGETMQIFKQCALKMRAEVKGSVEEQPWPPKPEKLNNDNMKMPKSLTDFFNVLLTGKADETASSAKVQRLVQSFAQDCVYAICCGISKPAKHILLPWTVKALTGNVELIKILNRLGHGISYSQLEEIDTALCLQKLANEDEFGIAIPSNMVAGVPTHLAYDNIDRLEETLSGSGTSHRVNGIIVQPLVPIVELPAIITQEEKLKRRSITPTPVLFPLYNVGSRVGPPLKDHVDFQWDEALQTAKRKNQVWSLVRQTDVEHQKVSSWTGFNIKTHCNAEVSQDKVGYLPTINAPATDMSTVNAILLQCLKIMEKLDLKEIACCFDQALYAKATEIAWKDEAKFQPLVLTMGAFHTICNLMGTIGKRFQDAGLRDLAIESGIVAEGSINAVMEGRQYNRALRLHKLVYEAFLRQAWKGFYAWLENHHIDDVQVLSDAHSQIETLFNNTDEDQLDEVLKDPSCIHILQRFDEYLDFLRKENGDLSAFWVSYIDAIEIVLGLIRASREGNWLLHLAMIRETIPWCFAYDRQNYARYLPVYYRDMSRLAIDHPQMYDYFLAGGFAVQLGTSNPFGRIPVDQTIEETANKDTQTPGGTKGFSLKAGAVSRFYLTAEYRSTCLRNLRQMTGSQPQTMCHADLEPSRITKDEKDVGSLTELLENTWVNPFESPSELISLSSGRVAPDPIRNDLLEAKEKGERAYKEFRQDRLECDQTRKKFHDRLKKLKLKTFSDMQKTKKTRTTSKEVVLKADHKLFGHMVLVAGIRNLDMRQVLQHPLGPLPWALSNCDGTLKKTNKAALARDLEKRAAPAEDIPTPSACIIDGMSLVNKVSGEHRTFGELSECIFASALQAGRDSKRIDVVFDVYKENSIKTAERDKRGSDTGVLYKKVTAGQRIQQWKKLLRCSSSKTSLIQFLAKEWKSPHYLRKLNCKEMFVTSGEECFHLTESGSCNFGDLETFQEEADTRLLLHAKQPSAGHEAVIIVSEDTDVVVLCLAFQNDIANVYIRCGTKTRSRYIDIKKIATSLGANICTGLIGLHSFTGCDTVSAFGGRGKLAGLKLISKEGPLQRAMISLGQHWDLTPDLFIHLQEFTCKLYSPQSTTTQVNDLRYQLFRLKKGDIESGQLPTCEDALYLHAKRANYQAAIWRRTMENHPHIPAPQGHGWSEEDGHVTLKWMEGSPAPDVVLELMACACNKECKLPKCQCLAYGIKCTPACKLQMCDNMIDEEQCTLSDDIEDASSDTD